MTDVKYKLTKKKKKNKKNNKKKNKKKKKKTYRVKSGGTLTKESILEPYDDTLHTKPRLPPRPNELNEMLLVATNSNDFDLCRTLLDAGADVNTTTNGGSTPLYFAAGIGNIDLCQLFIDNGANINHQNNNGSTALIKSAIYNKSNICRLLIDNGADIDIYNMKNQTALYFAGRNKNIDIIQLLLDLGADPNIVADDGWAPIRFSIVKDIIEQMDVEPLDVGDMFNIPEEYYYEYEYEQGLTSDKCSDYNINEPIDLEKIDVKLYNKDNPNHKVYIVANESDIVDNIYSSSDINIFISYRGVPLNNIEYISRGNYGMVLKYSSETPIEDGWERQKEPHKRFRSDNYYYYHNKELGKSLKNQIPRKKGVRYYEVAIKFYKYPSDNEIKIIKELKKTKDPNTCNIVNARLLHYELKTIDDSPNIVFNACIMELMDGTLFDLIPLNIVDTMDIIKKLAEHLQCIKDTFGMVYGDLKPLNILYKCYKNNKIKLVVGDLGGLCNNQFKCATTFPPPEGIHVNNVSTTFGYNSITVWQLGIFVISLLNYENELPFYWDNIQKMTSQMIIEEIEKIIYELNNIMRHDIPISDILLRMLDVNPRTRITMDELMSIL